MYLGRVVGCVWSTVKDPNLVGQRLLLIQPMTPDWRDNGKQLICLDATGAGAGEAVYWVRGREASFPFLPAEVPADTTVVGIVDSIHLAKAATAVEAAPAKPAPAKALPAASLRPGRASAARKGR
ncbi:MAG: EutN/CcmL family microcompartment protein [Bryobacteraceae bacterium]|jgi:microcompartment protein CcmK/EutM